MRDLTTATEFLCPNSFLALHLGFGGRLAGYKNVLFQLSLLRLAFAFDLQASVLEWNGS